jgi:hypothetical protein
MSPESVSRIEPARLEEPTGPIAEVVADLAVSAATLGKALHPLAGKLDKDEGQRDLQLEVSRLIADAFGTGGGRGARPSLIVTE